MIHAIIIIVSFLALVLTIPAVYATTEDLPPNKKYILIVAYILSLIAAFIIGLTQGLSYIGVIQ